MKVLFAASEAVPFCKTGGLADVAGSLPQALVQAGNEVAVILPLYQKVAEGWKDQMSFVCNIEVPLGWRRVYCGLFRLDKDGVIWYFVDNEYYFKREALYGHYDDGERFGFFSRAVISLLPALAFMPEIIHCNDWQTSVGSRPSSLSTTSSTRAATARRPWRTCSAWPRAGSPTGPSPWTGT